MATYILDKNLKATWNIDDGLSLWRLPANLKIATTGETAISEIAGYSDNRIEILGALLSAGKGIYAAHLSGDGTEINIGSKGHVVAYGGILADGTQQQIYNRGVIDANFAGIYSIRANSLTNEGTIEGRYGIYAMANDSAENGEYISITNQEGGAIRGTKTGVLIESVEYARIDNYGTILGKDYAVNSLAALTVVLNEGRIKGDVHLGDAGNTFDSRNGTVDGTVFAGAGNDNYNIGKQRFEIVDAGGDDSVFVFSNFYKAHAGIENVTINVNRDTTIVGNALANTLTGASGDDTIAGGGGGDVLNGWIGDDRLTGNAGADTFQFDTSLRGKDVITDFTQGQDEIEVYSGGAITTFEQVLALAKNKGGDVVITASNDHSVTIEGLHVKDLEAADFQIML